MAGSELLRYDERVRSSRLLILVLVLTTACGQARATNPATPPASTAMTAPKPGVALAGFAARTARAGSARVVMQMRMAACPGRRDHGRRDRRRRLPRRAAAMQHAHDLAGSGAVIQMREIMRWPVVYMRSPLFAASHRGKGPWVRLDMARLERAQGIDMNALTSTGSSDPTQMLSTLEGESDSIVTVGHARCAASAPRTTGRSSTSARWPGPRRRRCVRPSAAPRRGWLRCSASSGCRWTSGSARRPRAPRRLPHGDADRRHGGTLDDHGRRLDMYAFGVPVHVAAPPARRTTDLTAAVAAGCRLRIVSPA